MSGDRRDRIVAALTSADGQLDMSRLCVVAAEIASVSGAGIMLMAGDRPQGSVCTSDAVSALIEELQYTLGEGPCVDAHVLDRPVAEEDLVANGGERWPAFTPPAVDAGARALFGFPLQIGAARLGALNLYRDRPGPLSAEEHADALVFAELAARSVLAAQANATPGDLAAELEVGANFRFVVHQAAGMVAVQARTSVADALTRLRVHAFTADRSVQEVARDVVNRDLRFPPAESGDK